MNLIALRNSDCLLSEYPLLKKSPLWEAFVGEYDRPKSIKFRDKAIKSCRGTQSASAKELEEHCRAILSVFFMVREKADDAGSIYTAKEVDLARMKAAEELAKKIRIALSPSKEGGKLRNAIRAESVRLNAYIPRLDRANNDSIVCVAFLKFIEREIQLPTKKELNIEVNHLKKCDEVLGKRGGFGKTVEINGSHRIVYDCFADYVFNDDDEVIKESWRSRTVAADQWNKAYWVASSGLAEYTTKLGLKGLSEAHKDKGKKG